MNMKQVAEVLNDLGLKVNYHPDRILEAAGPYANYYQLEKMESMWEYSRLDFERKFPPEKIVIKKFNSEENELKEVALYYIKKYIHPFFLRKLKEVY